MDPLSSEDEHALPPDEPLAQPPRVSLRRVVLAVLPAALLFGGLLVARHTRLEWGPAPGQPAPDFALLPLQDGRPGSTPVRLADLRGRPVALAFGSYT